MFSRKMLGAGGVTTREKHCSSKTGAWGLMSSGHESNRGARGICGNSAIFAFYDSSQAQPKRQPRCSCSLLHAMCELWCATGCYQTCRKLALADLVKSSGAEANRPISQCSRSSKFCTVAKKSCSKDTGLGCFPHCDSVQPV